MNQDFSDELISAYLDGELTAEEQTQVEQMLVESAEHRRLFEELRALRDSLQALPNYQLPDEFADRVLRRAQRAMSESEASGQKSVSPSLSDAGNWRSAVTAMAGVAAALVISVVLLPSPNTAERSIARNHDGSAPTADDSAPTAGNNDVGKLASDESILDKSTFDSETYARETVDVTNNDERDSLGLKPSTATSSTRVPAFSAPVVAAPGRSLREAGEETQAAKKNSNGRRSRGRNLSKGLPENEKFAAPTDESEKLPTAPAPTAGFGGVASAVNEKSPAPPNAYSMPAQATVDRYVVIVDMPDKAFASGVLDQALVRRGIAMSSSSEEAAETNSLAKNRGIVAGEPTAERTTSEDDALESKMTDGSVDVVLVEAPIGQIQATLDELHRSGHLVALSVHPEHRADGALYYQQPFSQPAPEKITEDLFANPSAKNYRKDASGKSATTDGKVVGSNQGAASSKKLDAAIPSPETKPTETQPTETKAAVAAKNKARSGQREKQVGGKDIDKLVEDRAELPAMRDEAKKKLSQRKSGYARRVTSPEEQQSIQMLERSYRSSTQRQADLQDAELATQKESPPGGAAGLFKFADSAPGNQQQGAQDRIVHLSLVIRSVPSPPASAASLKADAVPAKD